MQPADRARFWQAFAVNLGLNAGWTAVIFGARRPNLALLEIAALNVSNLALLKRAWRADRLAGAALVPYVAWTGFATALNGNVALVVLVIEAGLSGDVPEVGPSVFAAEFGVCWVPVPVEVIVVGVRWYLRYCLSYRDVEELLIERGVEADHVTVYRWVQRFAPLLADAARFARHAPGDRWFVDETYVKVNSACCYVYPAIDQDGQVIDVLVSTRRDAARARRFIQRGLTILKVSPSEVVTDAAPMYRAVLEELIASAWQRVERDANNPIEAVHSQLKHRLRPMRGLRTDRTAQTIIASHAFVQKSRLRRARRRTIITSFHGLGASPAHVSSPRTATTAAASPTAER